MGKLLAKPTSEAIFKDDKQEWERERRIAKGTNTEFKTKKPRKICYLKNAPNDMVRTTLSFIEDGEDAFNKELTRLTMRLKQITNFKDNRELTMLLRELRENKKSIYGDRRRITAKVDGSQIDAERIRKIFEEGKGEKNG